MGFGRGRVNLRLLMLCEVGLVEEMVSPRVESSHPMCSFTADGQKPTESQTLNGHAIFDYVIAGTNSINTA
jgi:hypothetical protein